MSKQTPTSFESTDSALRRLLNVATMETTEKVAHAPASNAAVVFGAIIQARAIDRLTKAVEANTRAIMIAAGKNPDDGQRR
jgi:hypothetical protein